jgi:hypothetical protein
LLELADVSNLSVDARHQIYTSDGAWLDISNTCCQLLDEFSTNLISARRVGFVGESHLSISLH